MPKLNLNNRLAYLLSFISLLTAPLTIFAQEIMTLSTRPAVTQSYILIRAPIKSSGIAVLFRGSNGLMHSRIEGGRVRFSMEGFLPRSHEEFLKRELNVAIVDAPSDQQGSGMSVDFRRSPQHFTDIMAVIADVSRLFPALPLFLVGTSRGTVSVVSVAAANHAPISGVILTATFFRTRSSRSAKGRPLWGGLDFDRIRSPILFVHHVNDPCPRAPYEGALQVSQKYPLISVSGGLDVLPNQCQPLGPHGFYGKEAETVEQMVNWMLKKPFKNRID